MSDLTRDKFLTQEEASKIKHTFHMWPNRDTALIYLALTTGARRQELLNLRFSDFKSQVVYICGLKGSRDRICPVPKDLFNFIMSLDVGIEYKKPFPISAPRVWQVWDYYRPVKKKFHSLRHTFAVMLYKNSKDIRFVQTQLGHRSLTSTMIYLDFTYSEAETKKKISGFWKKL